jgi:hypothetical protein
MENRKRKKEGEAFFKKKHKAYSNPGLLSFLISSLCLEVQGGIHLNKTKNHCIIFLSRYLFFSTFLIMPYVPSVIEFSSDRSSQHVLDLENPNVNSLESLIKTEKNYLETLKIIDSVRSIIFCKTKIV